MKSKLCLVALVGFAAGVAVSVWLRPQQEVRAETSSKPKLEYRLEPLSLPPPPATTRGNTPAPRVETPQQTADRVSRAINKSAAARKNLRLPSYSRPALTRLPPLALSRALDHQLPAVIMGDTQCRRNYPWLMSRTSCPPSSAAIRTPPNNCCPWPTTSCANWPPICKLPGGVVLTFYPQNN